MSNVVAAGSSFPVVVCQICGLTECFCRPEESLDKVGELTAIKICSSLMEERIEVITLPKARKGKAPPVQGELGWVNPAWEADIEAFGYNKNAAMTLLETRNFRNEFRQKLRDQIVQWLDTPREERKFQSPLSPKQWECVQPFDYRKRYGFRY